ncbi:helix-turn-helix domain-containing protein [Streptomyces lunaelactis]|uniref:helix-turn-helix domain-containing protein n=1 Tax=Streptomyces lunaelactis TaxID=1535768 RepID=UPI00281588A8|nr:helix-turn-helix domain-containing protein [Streptomyces lunaelactis]
MTLAVPERDALAGPLLYRVEEAMKRLRMSRTVIYDLIRTGRLRSVKEGRTRLIPASALTEYVALLEREAGGPQ